MVKFSMMRRERDLSEQTSTTGAGFSKTIFINIRNPILWN